VVEEQLVSIVGYSLNSNHKDGFVDMERKRNNPWE